MLKRQRSRRSRQLGIMRRKTGTQRNSSIDVGDRAANKTAILEGAEETLRLWRTRRVIPIALKWGIFDRTRRETGAC